MELTIEGLRFGRDGRRVLDIPRLDVASGSTTALFGPNGSGKTTLLRLVAALERPESGNILLGGAVATRRRVGRCVAFAFQDAVFVGGTVRYNLELGLRLRGVPQAERLPRIEEVARECGVAHLMDRSARRLSRGEAQRVNVARALALRAPITLLDEPLAGMDRAARTQTLDELPRLLATLAATTIIVTHDREEAFRLAEHLIVLAGGVVHAAGPTSDVYRNPPDRETAELLGYMVVAVRGELHAIPAGGLRLGDGRAAFDLTVNRVVDMGDHRQVFGSAGGASVQLRLPAGVESPAAGSTLVVAPESSVRLQAGD